MDSMWRCGNFWQDTRLMNACCGDRFARLFSFWFLRVRTYFLVTPPNKVEKGICVSGALKNNIFQVRANQDSCGPECELESLDKIYNGLSYSSLLSSWQALPICRLEHHPQSYPEYSWVGQVYARRELHRSLIFFSLCADGSHGCYSRVEVLIRRDVVGVERMREEPSIECDTTDTLHEGA